MTDYMEQCSYLNLQVPQLVKEFPIFYGTQRFITMFIYPYPLADYSRPQPSVLFISYPLGLPSGLIFFIFLHHKPASTSLIHTTGTAHLIVLDFITQLIFSEDYNSWNSSLCNFLQSSATFSILGPNIFLSSLVHNTLHLCSTLHVSD